MRVMPLSDESTFEPPLLIDSALENVSFRDHASAEQRWQRLARDESERAALSELLRPLVAALRSAANPDVTLINIERFLDAVPQRDETLKWLGSNPRAIEILVRLFVGSPSLTELLVREPDRLRWLTEHSGLGEFPPREVFVNRALAEAEDASADGAADPIAAFRRYQRRELLRIAASDTFHLVDLKTATRQLSLLADAIIRVVLEQYAAIEGVAASDVSVIAFGKLGGLELNYSSDIDLLFVGNSGSREETALAQQVIRALSHAGADGFLYRVDMRLRPWGQSGPLVTTREAYLDYLSKRAELWEKQAILKARIVAGNEQLGRSTLEAAAPIIFATPEHEVRANVLSMKAKIEKSLSDRRRSEGHVKSGEGGIRDIEFVTQFLQLTHGRDAPSVRSPNTTDALLRLFDIGAIEADQYRALSAGYMFHRVVEHALQLQDMSARHALPTDTRELEHLARRLDFPSQEVFLRHFRGHCQAVRAVFDEVVGDASRPRENAQRPADDEPEAALSYRETFSAIERAAHVDALRALGEHYSALPIVEAKTIDGKDSTTSESFSVVIVGRDVPGALSCIAGLLLSYGFDVVAADVFSVHAQVGSKPNVPCFVNRFDVVRIDTEAVGSELWGDYAVELSTWLRVLDAHPDEAYAGIAGRVADSVFVSRRDELSERLLPIEVSLDDLNRHTTIMQLRTLDSPGVLFNLATAITLANLNVQRVMVRTTDERGERTAVDTFYVTSKRSTKLASSDVMELRAAIVLTAQFTHLLPHSADARRALVQFREFLEDLFARDGWMSELAALQDSGVLLALTRLLGVSEFLWDDFLRYQHENLFPIVSELDRLQERPTRDELETQLNAELERAFDDDSLWVGTLNRFKDREMLRVDMRQILNVQTAFNTFGRELTDVSEVVVAAATRHFAEQHGVPLDGLAVCALGKCGGMEMGFASDIELMFVYDPTHSDVRPEAVERLVHGVRKAIRTTQGGVFEIDLRLRPHGKAGPLAVSLESFQSYFAADGPAWPYERQALVKLRTISINPASTEFNDKVIAARDAAIYCGSPVDVEALRGMRERQIRQLVEAETFNAKLSPGGLVDIEYSVQLLQRRFGHLTPALRVTNTRDAIKGLVEIGLITEGHRVELRDAYRFLRRVINGLRMVRGNAEDLTVPPPNSDERRLLVRRLHPHVDADTFDRDFETHIGTILEFVRILPELVDANVSAPSID